MTKDLFDFDFEYGPLAAGIDEAGRGPLAGPVVCACCIMPRDRIIEGINDSKKIPEKKREELFEKIVDAAVAYNVGIIEHTVIDEINILNATKLGMRRAYEGMKIKPEIVLIDAVKLDIPCKTVSIVKGDAKSYAIAAASIIAKVTRDRLMRQYDALYPEYGFAANKGYGTAAHIEAIGQRGISPIHRKTFKLKAAGDEQQE